VKINVDQPPSTEAVITSLLLVHTHTVFALVVWRNPARALPPRSEAVRDRGLQTEVALEKELLLLKLARTTSPAITKQERSHKMPIVCSVHRFKTLTHNAKALKRRPKTAMTASAHET
jgi:hypothetical protein